MAPVVGMLYLAACVVCGYMGRNTTLGFVGHMIIAFLLSPVVDFLILLAARPGREIRRRMEKAGLSEP